MLQLGALGPCILAPPFLLIERGVDLGSLRSLLVFEFCGFISVGNQGGKKTNGLCAAVWLKWGEQKRSFIVLALGLDIGSIWHGCFGCCHVICREG